MDGSYIYRKPVRHSLYKRFKRRLRIAVILLVVVGIAAYFIVSNLHAGPKTPPVSGISTSTVSDQDQTYTSPFFKFKDSGGKWILEKDRSTASTFIYDKYQGQSLQGQIIFYVNQDTYMGNGFTRVLPVRIVNTGSFEVTGVSDPCVSQYGPADPHITKEIEYNGTMMYCNAGDTQYTVVVGEIGGDYHLNLKRSDGSPLQVEITYKYNGLGPDPSSLINVISSFQAT